MFSIVTTQDHNFLTTSPHPGLWWPSNLRVLTVCSGHSSLATVWREPNRKQNKFSSESWVWLRAWSVERQLSSFLHSSKINETHKSLNTFFLPIWKGEQLLKSYKNISVVKLGSSLYSAFNLWEPFVLHELCPISYVGSVPQRIYLVSPNLCLKFNHIALFCKVTHREILALTEL